MTGSFRNSKVDFDVARGCAHTDLNARAGLLDRLAGAQVANATALHRDVARVADAHATSVLRGDAGGLGSFEKRQPGRGLDVFFAQTKSNDSAVCIRIDHCELQSKALDVKLAGDVFSFKTSLDRIEERRGPTRKGLTLAPIEDESFELARIE